MPPTKTFADFGIDIPPGKYGEVRAICPKCTPGRRREHQREKDLAVNTDKGVWECHHPPCGWTGSLGGGDWRDAIKPKPRPIAPVQPTNQVQMYAWFGERGIPREIVDAARITANGGIISFPYFANGQHVHTSFRTFPAKKFWQDAESERTFYGMDDVTTEDTSVIICEGQIDKLSFAVAGYPNCLSIPDGGVAEGKASDRKMAYLKDAQTLLDRVKRVYLACDNDSVGRATNEELARRIGREKCWTVRWPSYIKDANEALVQVGPSLLAECIEQAQPYPVEGIYSIDTHYDEFVRSWSEPEDQGARTLLYANHDRHYRPRAGLLSIVTGIPGHGKSLWLDHIIMALATNNDWRVGYYSPENQPLVRHMRQLAEIHLRKPFRREQAGAMTMAEIQDVVTPMLRRHFVFLLPVKTDITTILNRARIAVFREGLQGLVLDPWNTIEQACPSGTSATQYVAEVLGAIKQFAAETSCHVWLVAHPTKLGQGRSNLQSDEDRKEPLAGMYDISTSANFFNMADYGITIWRDKKDPTAPSKCVLNKIRFEETGKEGTVLFRIDRTQKTMTEVVSK